MVAAALPVNVMAPVSAVMVALFTKPMPTFKFETLAFPLRPSITMLPAPEVVTEAPFKLTPRRSLVLVNTVVPLPLMLMSPPPAFKLLESKDTPARKDEWPDA